MNHSQLFVEINNNWKLTGKRIWHPTTSDSGMIKAQFHPGICHSKGMTSVVKMIIMAIAAKQMMKDNLKRCHIRGTDNAVDVTTTTCRRNLKNPTFNPKRGTFDFFSG